MESKSIVNNGSGNGLLPDGTKPFPEPMLTFHQSGPVAFKWWQFHRKHSRYQPMNYDRKFYTKLGSLISQGPMNDAVLCWLFQRRALRWSAVKLRVRSPTWLTCLLEALTTPTRMSWTISRNLKHRMPRMRRCWPVSWKDPLTACKQTLSSMLRSSTCRLVAMTVSLSFIGKSPQLIWRSGTCMSCWD